MKYESPNTCWVFWNIQDQILTNLRKFNFWFANKKSKCHLQSVSNGSLNIDIPVQVS